MEFTMSKINYTHTKQINLVSCQEAFLTRCKSQSLSPGTLHFYRIKLSKFTSFCLKNGIYCVLEITPTIIREYFLFLEKSGHNPGGRHAHFRALRTFLAWFGNEYEPQDWINPITKIKAPKVSQVPLEPVSGEAIRQILETCRTNKFTDLRDRAIILFLFDTGVRANELLSLNIDDVDLYSGHCLIKNGKGGKYRTVIIGKTTTDSISAYLMIRSDNNPALFVTQPNSGSNRLVYSGLRSMLKRRASKAGIDPPTLHSFRRAFALSMVRNGVDLFTLQKMMGHASIDTLKHYLKHTTDDIRQAHERYGPVDHALVETKINDEERKNMPSFSSIDRNRAKGLYHPPLLEGASIRVSNPEINAEAPPSMGLRHGAAGARIIY